MDAIADRANKMADELLAGYLLPDLSESDLVLNAEAWLLMADIDLLQADLAGSRTWESSEGGEVIRSRLAAQSRGLVGRATQQGLPALSARMANLCTVIESVDLA